MDATERRASPLSLLFIALVIGFCLAGLGKLQLSTDYRIYFAEDHPLLQNSTRLSELFGQQDSLLIILAAPHGRGLLDTRQLLSYDKFEIALAEHPGISKILGFHQFSVASDEADLFSTDGAVGAERTGQTNPWLSSNQRYGLIDIRLNPDKLASGGDQRSLFAFIETTAQQHLLDTRSVEQLEYAGGLALNRAYLDVVRHDLQSFAPSLVLVLSVLLYWIFRHIRLVVACLLGGLLATLATLGVSGWAGWPIAAINAFTPVILIALFLAMAMHQVIHWLDYLQQGNEEAAWQSNRDNRLPLLLSALSSAVGFLLLYLSPSPPIQTLGLTVAVGIAVIWLLCRFVLPFVLDFTPVSEASAGHILARISIRPLLEWPLRYRKTIIATSAGLCAIALVNLPSASINDHIYHYFPEQHPFSQALTRLDQEFYGCERLVYALADDFASRPQAEKQSAIHRQLDDIKNISFYQDIYTLVEQQGIALEQAQSVGEQNPSVLSAMGELVNKAQGHIQLSVFSKALDASALLDLDEDIQQAISRSGKDYIGGYSPGLTLSTTNLQNAQSMFVSLAIAIGLITLLFALVTRKASLVFAALLCNLLPLLIVYGFWIASGGYISLGAAVVMGLVLGIIADDTIHILVKLRPGNHGGWSRVRRGVYPAIVVTSVVLAAGLIVGILSEFRPLRELSLLSSLIIFTAMLVDTLLLPAVLDNGYKEKGDQNHERA